MGVTDWVDKSLYPFEPKWFDVDHKTLHYIDVGQGDPVVFVHGTPMWSFMYRDMIKDLKTNYRCIAVDNIGFGLSQKPSAYTYRPEKMAEYLSELIRHLDLKNITFVLNGIGGPIGLSYAIDHPQNVRHIVLLNTFMWPLSGNKKAEKIAETAEKPMAKWLQLNYNFAVNSLLKTNIKDRTHYSKAVHSQYLKPFATPETRHAPLGFAKALVSSGPWYQSLWDRRESLKRIPALLLWGLQDEVFGEQAITKWQEIWPDAKVKKFKTNGLYLAEEQGAGLVPDISMFLNDTDYLPTHTVDI